MSDKLLNLNDLPFLRASRELAPFLRELPPEPEITGVWIDEAADFGDPNDSTCAHEWEYTGTAYGGDDPRWHGEGRCICRKCGADGDA